MIRGVLATTSALVFVLAVHVPAARAQHGQHGHSGATHPAHATPPAAGPSTQAHGGPSHTTSPAHAATKMVATTGTVRLTPVQRKVTANTKLASELQSRLPAGTNLTAAAGGFRNFGQFVAAVNVSHNLGIPFSQLKTDMVTRHMSLGRSIQDLRPSARARTEVERAEAEDRELVVEVEREATAGRTHHAKKHTSGDK